ncbi:ATPase family gene 2 protein homolog A [Phlebotomus argentipes]|uniref:ATPase family gene 2 protein homolog A n=1 Tax=Phlebotomus argentipes TaxID=94469 RepID=UPI0028930E45|nr:ATPase family gene 2 protein homolog A [Phlebotomus argentipes]
MHVLPVKDIWYRKIQKCYLSEECFSGNLRPGCWIICRLSDGSEVISRAFPHSRRIFSQNLAYLDQSVTRNTSQNSEGLSLVDFHPAAHVADFREAVSVDVFVNNITFPEISQRDTLEMVLKRILRLYTFSRDCEILLEDFCPLPITAVKVTCCREEGIGSISPDAALKISNIVFQSQRKRHEESFIGYHTIEETISDILMRNVKYLKSSAQKFTPPNEILIVGSSGVGKTTLIHHLARKFHCNVFSLDPMDFHGQYPGESEEMLDKFRQTITDLSKNQEDRLSIVTIEDIDVLCPKESASGERNNTEKFGEALMNFLEKMSGVKGVLLMATAKDVTNLSGHARRKGRLEVEIFLKNPDKKEREEICRGFLKGDEELCAWIAERTSGFVAGDLKMLIEKGKARGCLKSQLKAMRLSSVRSSNLLVESDSVDFEDLGGLGDLKRTIEVTIVAPLKDSSAFDRMGIEMTKGILFYGPPGCAKTTIVRALAKKTHMPLLAISPAQVYSPYVGDSERFLARVFHEARMCAPSILFIDELDALVGCRQRGGSSDVQSRILAVLLTALDGIGRRIDGAPEGNVLAVAATNRPDVIDEALLRPGRFDKLIHVPPPVTANDRVEILRKITHNMPIEGVNLELIAKQTRNFSGADLRSLCREAALQRLTVDLSADSLTQEDFLRALAGMRPSLTDTQIAWYRDFEGNPYL